MHQKLIFGVPYYLFNHLNKFRRIYLHFSAYFFMRILKVSTGRKIAKKRIQGIQNQKSINRLVSDKDRLLNPTPSPIFFHLMQQILDPLPFLVSLILFCFNNINLKNKLIVNEKSILNSFLSKNLKKKYIYLIIFKINDELIDFKSQNFACLLKHPRTL